MPTSKRRAKAKLFNDPELRAKYDLDVRKHLHVKLYTETKRQLKKKSLEMDVSIQEMFECLANAIIKGDQYIIRRINQWMLDREKEDVLALTEFDVDSLYKAAAEEEEQTEEDDV